MGTFENASFRLGLGDYKMNAMFENDEQHVSIAGWSNL